MENLGLCSGERQQGVCDLPKGEGTPPFPVLPCFPWIPDRPFPLPLPGVLGNTSISQAEPTTPSLGTADTKKNQNISPSSSFWIKPGSFSLQSSPYLEAAPSPLPSPCSSCEINVYFCAQLLPVPHVPAGK